VVDPCGANPGALLAAEPLVPAFDPTEPLVRGPRPRLEGVRVGTICEFTPAGEPLVDHPDNPAGRPLSARSTVRFTGEEVGREVVLMFEAGDARRPVVLGLVEPPRPVPRARPSGREVVAAVDGERLVLTAETEIELRCGEASITLTRAGKVLIRGAYLLSRSSGVNRIKGGSVQIN
jgi:Domain of unknown function (DUF6484)